MDEEVDPAQDISLRLDYSMVERGCEISQFSRFLAGEILFRETI